MQAESLRSDSFRPCSEGREFDLDMIEVEDSETGVTKTLLGGEIVKTKNRGPVFARELVATDSI